MEKQRMSDMGRWGLRAGLHGSSSARSKQVKGGKRRGRRRVMQAAEGSRSQDRCCKGRE